MTIHLYDQALAQGARRRLRATIESYFTLLLGSKVSAQDIINLGEQALDAVDSVPLGYPPLQRGILHGIETVDTRTLAVD